MSIWFSIARAVVQRCKEAMRIKAVKLCKDNPTNSSTEGEQQLIYISHPHTHEFPSPGPTPLPPPWVLPLSLAAPRQTLLFLPPTPLPFCLENLHGGWMGVRGGENYSRWIRQPTLVALGGRERGSASQRYITASHPHAPPRPSAAGIPIRQSWVQVRDARNPAGRTRRNGRNRTKRPGYSLRLVHEAKMTLIT